MASAKFTRKLELYNREIPGIRAYKKRWLPLVLVLSLWGFASAIFMEQPLYDIAIRGGLLTLVLSALVSIQSPDKATYGVNLAFLIYMAIYQLCRTTLFFIVWEDPVDTVYGGCGVLYLILYAVDMIVNTFEIFKLIFTFWFSIFYFVTIVRHREFFYATAKQLWDDN